ncbi:MAG: DUF2956 domain-containing protein [Algicola sp.]|nr:DUF2956 domain-containing protein [Algicola sp.]
MIWPWRLKAHKDLIVAQYKKKQKPSVSAETVNEAEAVAKATQRPGQTKEQTKLIAQGIQKGIEEYKKRNKGKARELDKKLKKVSSQQPQTSDEVDEVIEPQNKANLLPWILLVVSWIGFAAYLGLAPMSK